MADLGRALGLENPVYVQSAEFVAQIAKEISTFHHHFHIIWPLLAIRAGKTYVEIGCFAGASVIAAAQCPTVSKIVSIDSFSAFADQMAVARANIDSHAMRNKRNLSIELIKGCSHDRHILAGLYQKLLSDPDFDGIDVLFIDGDHSYAGVVQDYEHLWPLVSIDGGFIVFDDYADAVHSPQVRPAVDFVAHKNQSVFDAVGQPANLANAHGNGLLTNEASNEYILQRRPIDNLQHSDAMFVICIATYCRADGSTDKQLRRLLNSISRQSCDSWFVIVVGDSYSDANEFEAYKQCLPPEKSHFVNLPIAGERDDTTRHGTDLWRCAGCSSMNYALMLAQKAKSDAIYVHADDDDYWESHHLHELQNVYANKPDAAFVWTLGSFRGSTLPNESFYRDFLVESDGRLAEVMPTVDHTLHSAVSWRIDSFRSLRYRITDMVTDGDMWTRMAEMMKTNKRNSYLVTKVTVHHPSQQNR